MEQTAKQVVFKGRVQGVGFRYTVHRFALQHHLTGFVKNCSDGTVEALFQGTAAAIAACMDDVKDAFIGYLRDVETTTQPVNPRYQDFRITY
jgi:acylphosphatase